MLVSSRATAVSSAAPHRFLTHSVNNFNCISSSLSLPTSFGSSSLINDDRRQKKINTTVGWSNRMDKKKISVVTCATASVAAQPLENADALIDSVETFIFDCDGVIWKGDSLIEGVPETLELLRSKGKRLVFVTNNSTKSRKQYGKKFESLGLSINEEEIFASSFAAAAYLQSIDFPKDKKIDPLLAYLLTAPFYEPVGNMSHVLITCMPRVFLREQERIYVIGEEGILIELELAGFSYLGGPEDGGKKIELKPGYMMEHDKDVGAVVVGFDRYFNYYKVQYGTLCVRENPGCLFLATNRDAVTHLTDAQEWAVVVGKPSTFMMDYLANKFSITKSQICMVGDRLDTDILFGQNGGCKTLLVLSGMFSLHLLATFFLNFLVSVFTMS
ncbi:HAD-like domain-containing protein [Cynara cardunculus var. scolymus]|uniref:HAD-like domain-containing protein n=1 Tax=Cynara cardunculus var. scolymus TaxID=59895 RepID=A0A103YEC2_CYNCS|nr:HAD-like domain-containing protein [Cynara cardunculus var. scolymus]